VRRRVAHPRNLPHPLHNAPQLDPQQLALGAEFMAGKGALLTGTDPLYTVGTTRWAGVTVG
jgi:hypothetical protein